VVDTFDGESHRDLDRSSFSPVLSLPGECVRVFAMTETRFDPATVADELERATGNYVVGSRLLFENDRIRVWDITLAPGTRLPFHCHRTSYFYRCESAGVSQVRTPDGRVATYESLADEVTFHEIPPGEALVHDLSNAGETVLRFTTVELLG
jgi:hypothetical protein